MGTLAAGFRLAFSRQWKVRADGRLRAGRASDVVSSPVAQPVDYHATRSMDGFRRLFNLGFKARFVLRFL